MESINLNELFHDMLDIPDIQKTKKIRAIDGMEFTISNEEYDYPKDKTGLAIVWFLFGEKKEYVFFTYYSILSFLRNTDAHIFNRYIVIPEGYEYEYLLPLFKQLGVGVKYTSKPFKYISSDSDIVKNHTHIFSVDSDCFAYTTKEPKNYFTKLSLYLQSLTNVGVLSPYLCMNLNKGGGLIMNRMYGFYIALTGLVESSLKKYYTDEEVSKKHFEGYHINDLKMSLEPLVNRLEGRIRLDELVTNFLSTQWPVNEVFCVSTEIYKDHLLYHLIQIAQTNQHWYWDDEIIYKIYFAINQQHNHHIIPLTKTHDNPKSFVIRPHGVPKLETMSSNYLYFIHPYNEIGDWWDIKDLYRVMLNEKPSEEGL
jgi:hypothetical protein